MNERIDPSKSTRLDALFDQAVDMDGAGQAELMRAVEREDAGLARTLASLLAADAEYSGRVTEQRERILRSSLAVIDVPGVGVGDRVGPYLLRECLGQGGMGLVFRAERADGQVQQEVALKIVRRALLDANGHERFLREREIVASFQHPSIARMLDVGQTADGSPYLAMELIRGLPITDWCDGHRLGTRGRIEVFLRVCAAVQHAHANLVLHRDLKPSNVLVGEDGNPKLIDFGIAKPIGLLADEHHQTATAARFFSPSNVAPEQLRGERVGVACDVYQLGTLLHELLCGTTVFESSGLTAGQFEQRILEMAPVAPSVRAAQASDASAQAHGAATPTALARELRGDLDAIVAQALRKPPLERYGSVDQLADDLRRWLDGQPVIAVRGRRWYRARKYLRRHALAIGISTAAVALVASFVTALWLQSQRIARERDHAEHVAKFLTDVFKAADPADSLSRDVPIGTVLDNARKRLASDLGSEPGERVRMLDVLAGVYASLDDPNTAVALLDDAQAIIEHSGSIDPRIVLAYDLQRARLMDNRGDRNAARAFATRAIGLQRTLGDSPGKQWEARFLVAKSLGDQDGMVAANATQALVDELAHDPDVPPIDFAREQVLLGHQWSIFGQTAKADRLIRQGLKTLEAHLPADHPDVLNARRSLADFMDMSLNQDAQAVTILKDVIARQRRVYGERSSSLARSLDFLGLDYSNMHQNDNAIAAMNASCAIVHQIHTRPHEDLLECASNLGYVDEMAGKYEPAVTSYVEAARIAAALNGEHSGDVAFMLREIARIRIREGRLDDAAQEFGMVYRTTDPLAAPHAFLAYEYADVLHQLHRDAEATAALASMDATLKKHPDAVDGATGEIAKLRKAIADGK